MSFDAGERVRYNIPAAQMIASAPWYPGMEGKIIAPGAPRPALTLILTPPQGPYWVVRWDNDDVRTHIVKMGGGIDPLQAVPGYSYEVGDIEMAEWSLDLITNGAMPRPWTL